MRAVDRAPATVERAAMSAEHRSERAAPLTCSLRSRFFYLASGGSLRALAAPFGEPPRGSASLKGSLSGRFGAGALRPVLGCNGVFALR